MEKTKAEGFQISVSSKLLEIGWQIRDSFIDNKYIKVADHNSENLSGRYILWKYFEKLGIVDKETYIYKASPLQRFDKDGNILPSDVEILGCDLF